MTETGRDLPPTLSEWAGGLGVLIVVAIGLWVWSAGGIYKAWYSFKYSVSPDKVHVDAKPNDWDFMRAPLGDKGCHYEAVVAAYNSAGVLFDEKKYFACVALRGRGNAAVWCLDPKITRVAISWVKVTD